MTNDLLIWCRDDSPHGEHWRQNAFNGRDYCSGRPAPKPEPADLLDEATRLADYLDTHPELVVGDDDRRIVRALTERVQQAEADADGESNQADYYWVGELERVERERDAARGKLDKVRDICDQANEGMPLVTFGGHVQSHRINVDDVLAILDEETGQRDTEPMADTNERPDEHSRVSTELGREEIRPWTLDPERYVLEFDGYEVDLERMRTSAEALDWIFQVAGKAWASDKAIAGLIFAIEGLLHPQESLCSGGGSKSMTEGEIRARIDDHADEFTD